ncbi:glycosyltransferase [Bradyrhizobium liaoningense]|uniref:rhamnosyltransferase WsaF family glycosyltransferase n=1 Tax=Bradyrhizobium liaoningense TaxID=43992 RepID=UPI001BAA050C|nr:glycosyltransferase [Bradyrhizobium liaoningense]MBR0823521.1 glycosyltransferase [Bradyrhizobium liaoningense]
MIKRTLHELYANHTGKMSDKWSLYVDEYERLFASMWDHPVRLLEIGVQNGGSLEIWSQFFPKAQAIVGCDINPDCERLTYGDPRIGVIVGDANDPQTQQRILQRSGQFDIVIDDGSHLSSDIVKTFALYFPHLAEGGIFVAEDLHCSYWDKFEGGLYYPYSSMTFFKRLADVINHEHWGMPKARGEILRGIFGKYGCELAEETLALVHSIEFINSMCVVRKSPAGRNGLGLRVISGGLELVVPANKEWSGTPYKLDPIFDETNNVWSNLSTAPEEMYVETVRDLGRSTELILDLKDRNEQLSRELDEIRGSTSWRMMAVPRLLATYMRTLASNAPGTGSLLPKFSAGVRSLRRSFSRSNSTTADRLRKFVLRHGFNFYQRRMKHTQLGRAIAQYVRDRGLISSFDLHSSSFPQGSLEIVASGPAHALDAEVHSQVPGYHLSLPLNFELADDLAVRPCVNVLLPSLRLKNMSGGPNTALLLACMMAERGERIRLIACDAPLEGEDAALLPYMERLLNRPVARDRFEIVDGFDRTRPIPIGIRDVFFATAWWTAQIANYAVGKTVNKAFIYLIQDFEPILHEGSTFQARAFETYGLPHIPVINTQLLLDHLIQEGAGHFADPGFVADALWFNPALDRTHYFPVASAQPGKKVLLFYARPSIARRNLFELGLVALRRAVASGAIDKDNWEVWAMGEKIPPIALGEGVMLNPLPWMSFDEYARRVRTADLMLSLMLSPHPSYPPLEMAASGKLVVTNSFAVKTAERLRAFSPNIIVAEATAESVGQAVVNAAGRINCGLPSYDPSGAMELPTDWDQSLIGIASKLIARLEAIRESAQEMTQLAAPGLPYLPKSDYEVYRKTSLTRRRSDGMYHQTPGLLSFVTTAYNTEPRFLEELGVSVFLQDGGVHFEWLILDNGSTEEGTRQALARLARHPGVRLERVENNLGIIGGMRYCLERASGRYILPLDSDDLIEPDCAHVLTRFIEDNNYPALLFTDEDKLDSGRFHSAYFKPDWDPVLFVHSCYIAHLCAIDRELGIQLSLYSDTSAEGCHDWDSFIRFMLAGKEPKHVPEVLYSWRIHTASTSGNIESKSYITESHRRTLQRFLDRSGAMNVDLVNSPLFQYNVDWWFRRKRSDAQSIQTILIGVATDAAEAVADPTAVVLRCGNLADLADAIDGIGSDLVHLLWTGVLPLDDEWRWDAMALLELFNDAVMVGGRLHDGSVIVDGPRVFGFGDGCDCPERGRALTDPGEGARMWKAHSVSAVSTAHCVVRTSFLKQCLVELRREVVGIEMLGPWLGALAAEAGKRVVYSPFMLGRLEGTDVAVASENETARWLSRFWSQLPETRFYSRRLGLTHDTAYVAVSELARLNHLRVLQQRTLRYEDWLTYDLRFRRARYPTPANPATISIVTPVYNGSDLDLLDELARSIGRQTLKPSQWLLIVNGAMPGAALARIRQRAESDWGARVIVEPKTVGIVAALRSGLEASTSGYVVPVDADDLITDDAIQILAHQIDAKRHPDFLFSDEDALISGRPAAPYLRGAYDPLLSLDNSTIWHLCAMKREAAIAAEVYCDVGANWCQDWDSVSRIADRGGRIEHVPEILYHWRQHSGSTTNNSGGDARQLESIRYILERQITRCTKPQNFEIADWPESRGARELYIARRPRDLPEFIWYGDALADGQLSCGQDAIMVFAGDGVSIDSRSVFIEATRLFELHPRVGVLGGNVVNADNVIVDGCYMRNTNGELETPWTGRAATDGGPYSLALKTQGVDLPGAALAFFRVSALKQVGLWPLPPGTNQASIVWQISAGLAAAGWTAGFSPLIRGRALAALKLDHAARPPAAQNSAASRALVRYGRSRNFVL